MTSLEEIKKAIGELEAQLSEVTHALTPVETKIKASEAREKELLAEFERKVQEERQRVADAKNQKAELNTKADSIRRALQELEGKFGEALEVENQKQRLENIMASYQEVWDSAYWSQFLKNYQKEDILFCLYAFEENRSGVLNANVMGAGKSLEAVAVLQLLISKIEREQGRHAKVLWLTEKALVRSTISEHFNNWQFPKMAAPMMGDKNSRKTLLEVAIANGLPVVTNYDAMNTTPALMAVKWDIVVMDEVSKLRGGANSNGPTKIFQNARELLGLEETYSGSNKYVRKDDAPFFMPLSGTPMENKVSELWCYLHLFDPQKFPSLRDFERRYVKEVYNAEENKYEKKASTDILVNVLRGQVIRQDPKMVKAAWPDKNRHIYVVDLDEEQRAAYDTLKNNFMLGLKMESEENPEKMLSVSSIIAQLTRLRQMAVMPSQITYTHPITGIEGKVNCETSTKLDFAMEKIEELTQDGENVVVWSGQFKEPIRELGRRLTAAGISNGVIDGDTSDSEKESLVDGFQQGRVKVLLATMKTMGKGANLQKTANWPGGACHAIFLDLWYNPSVLSQAEDRLHRTGQTDPVHIHVIHAADTVDNFVAAIVEKKQKEFEGIFGDEESTMTIAEWATLLEDLI